MGTSVTKISPGMPRHQHKGNTHKRYESGGLKDRKRSFGSPSQRDHPGGECHGLRVREQKFHWQDRLTGKKDCPRCKARNSVLIQIHHPSKRGLSGRLPTRNNLDEPADRRALDFSAFDPANPCHPADWLGKPGETYLLEPVYPVFSGQSPFSHGSQPRSIRYAVGQTFP